MMATHLQHATPPLSIKQLVQREQHRQEEATGQQHRARPNLQFICTVLTHVDCTAFYLQAYFLLSHRQQRSQHA